MMGQKARLFTPVSARSLDELVPANHFYRHLDRVLDLSFVRDLVEDSYAGSGRPSVDPVVFFKLALVMFFEGLRSERQLLRLAADRLSVRWYLGYNLDEPLPDHSSLTRIRTRYGLEVFRHFFDAIVEQCQQAGLVWGGELYFDATQVLADAAMESLTARFAVEAREAREALRTRQDNQVQQTKQIVAAHLAALFSNAGLQRPLEQDQARGVPKDLPKDLPDAPAAEAGSQECLEPISLPVALPETLREELAATNATRHDWIAQAGRQQRAVHGLYRRTADFRISATDADATPMRLKGGGTHLGYQPHYVVDGGKQRIIVGVLVAPGEVMENQPMLDLLWRVRFRWRLRPRQVTGDTTYGTIANIQAIEDMGIRAYVPLPDWEQQRPYFGPAKFSYDTEQDVYVCPRGRPLRRYHVEYTQQKVEYRGDPAICNACPLKARCTPSDHGRGVHRHFAESYLERVRAYHQTPAYEKAMRKRNVWVEPLCAEAKDWHGLRRFRLRRLWRVNSEALLIAAGQNLKRLLAKRGWGRRPLPSGAALVAKQSESALMYLLVLGILTGPRHYLDRRAHVSRWVE
jgi:transposase